jgi:hypothetical protein
MSKKPRIEEYQEPAGGWDRRFGDRPCTARTATALRGEAKRIFLALPRRNKNRRFGRKRLAAREGSALSNRGGSRVSGVPPVGRKRKRASARRIL